VTENGHSGPAPGGHRSYERRLWKAWLISPERLWLLSIGLHQRGHGRLGFWVKQLNTLLYRNSLPPGARVSPDVHLGHNSFGIMINPMVQIGSGVKIWHNVTITTRSRPGSSARVVIEDGVMIGAGAVVVAPRGQGLRIGRGARIGAGVVVTGDVPAGATVVCAPPRVLTKEQAAGVEDAIG
jgi:serine O-acetyltransferase